MGDIFEKCGPAARVCVDLGNVKVMDTEFMERMKAKGRYVETWREFFIDGFTPGWRLRQYLDEDEISRLAAVNLALLCRYKPASRLLRHTTAPASPSLHQLLHVTIFDPLPRPDHCHIPVYLIDCVVTAISTETPWLLATR